MTRFKTSPTKANAAKRSKTFLKKLQTPPTKVNPLRMASLQAVACSPEKSKEQKIAFCELYQKMLKNGTTISRRTFCENNNISKATFDGWWKKYEIMLETGIDNFGDGPGRDPYLDAEGTANITKWIDDRRANLNAPTTKEVHNKINEEVKASYQRRNKHCGHIEISQSTFKMYKTFMGLTERKAQYKPKARIEAEKDVRNAFSMFCLAKAFCSDLSPEMIINWDATQYRISGDGELKRMVRHDDGLDHIPPTAEGSGELDQFIKLYHLNNALGLVANPVFLLANPLMEEDEFIVHKVYGGGNVSNVGCDYCYQVYTKSRCGNDAFYRWFAKEIVVPFVIDNRKAYGSTYANTDVAMRAFITCDGEPAQIKVFQEEEMIKLFKDHDIDFAKTPASCSGICQASDVSKYFCATKCDIKKTVHLSDTWQNSVFERNTKDVMDSFR